MRKIMRYAVLLLGLISASAVGASTGSNLSQRTSGFDVAVVRLLQPELLFSQRSSAQQLSVSINAIEESLSAYAANQPKPDFIDSCAVYVAVRANQQLRTWTQCNGKDRRDIDSFIGGRIKPEQIASVNEGSLILSIHGLDSDPSNLDVALTPSEWRTAAKKYSLPEGQGLEMEHLVDLAWPK